MWKYFIRYKIVNIIGCKQKYENIKLWSQNNVKEVKNYITNCESKKLLKYKIQKKQIVRSLHCENTKLWKYKIQKVQSRESTKHRRNTLQCPSEADFLVGWLP